MIKRKQIFSADVVPRRSFCGRDVHFPRSGARPDEISGSERRTKRPRPTSPLDIGCHLRGASHACIRVGLDKRSPWPSPARFAISTLSSSSAEARLSPLARGSEAESACTHHKTQKTTNTKALRSGTANDGLAAKGLFEDNWIIQWRPIDLVVGIRCGPVKWTGRRREATDLVMGSGKISPKMSL